MLPEITLQTVKIWLEMCQHPEKYCDSCGKLKKFCRCQYDKARRDPKGGEHNDRVSHEPIN